MAMSVGERMVRSLRRVRQATGVSLAFGGTFHKSSGSLLLERFDGYTVGALPGVSLSVNEGLGGRAVGIRRAIAVDDYFCNTAITHRHDGVIRAEGLRSLIAAPLIVGREPVGVIYGALRGSEVVGDRIQEAILAEARNLEQEIVADSVRIGQTGPDCPDVGQLRERVRGVYQELRTIAGSVDSPELRRLLVDAAQKLAEQDHAGDLPDDYVEVKLTGREIDVVTCASSGMSNAQIAAVLGLTLNTAKSYMRSAMSKLGASTRLEATVRARQAGIIA